LAGSLVSSTHFGIAPLGVQSVWADLQLVGPSMQTLWKQAEPAGHTVPQTPQLFESLVTSVQTPPHIPIPAGHVPLQAPPTHACPAAQVIPQLPQLWASVAVSEQNAGAWAGVHWVCPGGQSAQQVPPTQTVPVMHGTPQAPQFAGSCERSVQYGVPVPGVQSVSPAVQAATHAPALQTSPAAQTWLQAPQFRTSEEVAAQKALTGVHVAPVAQGGPAVHSVSPGWQIGGGGGPAICWARNDGSVSPPGADVWRVIDSALIAFGPSTK
jgi:hypothetical protein